MLAVAPNYFWELGSGTASIHITALKGHRETSKN